MLFFISGDKIPYNSKYVLGFDSNCLKTELFWNWERLFKKRNSTRTQEVMYLKQRLLGQIVLRLQQEIQEGYEKHTAQG